VLLNVSLMKTIQCRNM